MEIVKTSHRPEDPLQMTYSLVNSMSALGLQRMFGGATIRWYAHTEALEVLGEGIMLYPNDYIHLDTDGVVRIVRKDEILD